MHARGATGQPAFLPGCIARLPFGSFDRLVDFLSPDLDSKSLTSSLNCIGTMVIGLG